MVFASNAFDLNVFVSVHKCKAAENLEHSCFPLFLFWFDPHHHGSCTPWWHGPRATGQLQAVTPQKWTFHRVSEWLSPVESQSCGLWGVYLRSYGVWHRCWWQNLSTVGYKVGSGEIWSHVDTWSPLSCSFGSFWADFVVSRSLMLTWYDLGFFLEVSWNVKGTFMEMCKSKRMLLSWYICSTACKMTDSTRPQEERLNSFYLLVFPNRTTWGPTGRCWATR